MLVVVPLPDPPKAGLGSFKGTSKTGTTKTKQANKHKHKQLQKPASTSISASERKAKQGRPPKVPQKQQHKTQGSSNKQRKAK